MSLIVQKFGGSSIADTHHIFNVAKTVTETYKEGHDVVVVVSAQGDTTDNLIDMAINVAKSPSKRELDSLMAAGEQMSSALLAIAIESMGFPAVSLLGWQAGFVTCDNYGFAKILKVKPERILKELKEKKIVVLAGFQGINENGDITTMGRGGSDTTAVAVAAAIKADVCKIYTDVDGVYTVDPRIVPTAKKINQISYDEMLELSRFGAQVLNVRSIESAKECNVEVEVLSSMVSTPGTLVRKSTGNSNIPISGIAVDRNIVKILVTGISDKDDLAEKIFSDLEKACIPSDSIFQPVGQASRNTLTFTVPKTDLERTVKILKEHILCKKDIKFFYDQNLAKISVVNVSRGSTINIASLIFESLSDAGIKVEMVACNDERVSILIKTRNVEVALNSMHKRFFEEDSLI